MKDSHNIALKLRIKIKGLLMDGNDVATIINTKQWVVSTSFAAICLVWYIANILISLLGYVQLRRYYSRAPESAKSLSLPTANFASEVSLSSSLTPFTSSSLSYHSPPLPHITVIRPIKGTEPYLRECLESTFRQTYPSSRLTICFCISSSREAALPLVKELIDEHPSFDAKIYIESEDPYIQQDGNGINIDVSKLGPNPKIRNMSRAYREAKGEIIWIIDCNVWVGKGVAGRMIDALCGYCDRRGKKREKTKFVHLLPLAIGTDSDHKFNATAKVNGNLSFHADNTAYRVSPEKSKWLSKEWYRTVLSEIMQQTGGKLEEVFMLSSHAKFYTAINTVHIAPCIVGKSTMFRRSHLDTLTALSPRTSPSHEDQPVGIDYFSQFICEDHLIGDLLWKKTVPEERASEPGVSWGKHALVYGDVAIRPTADMSIADYISRRVRWLRVRKFTVTLATLVEPATESLICSTLGAYGFTTLLDLPEFFNLGASWNRTWRAFALFWLTSEVCWVILDWTLYLMLRSGGSIEVDEHTPTFLRSESDRDTIAASSFSPFSSPRLEDVDQEQNVHSRNGLSATESLGRKSQRHKRCSFSTWFLAWLGREMLAFPIWFCAVVCGSTVVWHGRKFQVGRDMRVREVAEEQQHHWEAAGKCERKKTE